MICCPFIVAYLLSELQNESMLSDQSEDSRTPRSAINNFFVPFSPQIKAMADSKAVGVLVYALPGNPIQDMQCAGDECNTTLNIPAAMLHYEPAVAQALS